MWSPLASEFQQLRELRVLDIGYNRISLVEGECLGAWTNMTKLDLRHNCIFEIGPEVREMVNLEELYLQHNSLTELPAELGALRKLKVLDISDNKVEIIPASFGALKLDTFEVGDQHGHLRQALSPFSLLSALSLCSPCVGGLRNECVGQVAAERCGGAGNVVDLVLFGTVIVRGDALLSHEAPLPRQGKCRVWPAYFCNI